MAGEVRGQCASDAAHGCLDRRRPIPRRYRRGPYTWEGDIGRTGDAVQVPFLVSDAAAFVRLRQLGCAVTIKARSGTVSRSEKVTSTDDADPRHMTKYLERPACV